MFHKNSFRRGPLKKSAVEIRNPLAFALRNNNNTEGDEKERDIYKFAHSASLLVRQKNVRKYRHHFYFLFSLVYSPPGHPEHPPRVLAKLRERHAHAAFRLHPGDHAHHVVHVPREALEQDARPGLERDDKLRLGDQLRLRLRLCTSTTRNNQSKTINNGKKKKERAC